MASTLNLVCWNVNGIRAAQKKGFIEWVKKASPDILCLQETKAQIEQLDDELVHIDKYDSHFHSAEKKGYSGVAIYTRRKPIAVTQGMGDPKFDGEGRVISAEFPDFILYNIYFPNGGRGPERVQYKLEFYETILAQWQKLRKKGKKIIVCGDVNTAHKEIDVAKPKEWSKITGFLPEERAWLDKIVSLGYVDTFREFNDKPEQYTFWDQITRARLRNEGWRIDYFFVTKDLMPKVKGATIYADVEGSDHCPIGLELKI